MASFQSLQFATLFVVSPTMLACGPAFAQSNAYPNKPIRVIVGSSPGGGTDISARLVFADVAKRWDKSFVIENQPSAIGGVVFYSLVKMTPDGYTLVVSGNSEIVTAALIRQSRDFMSQAFTPVAQLTEQPYVLAASNALPVSSVKELLAYAKANPGKINYASSGEGSAAHIGMEHLKLLAGLDMVHIPYKGIGPAINDMFAGRIQLAFGSLLSVMPHAKNGKLKALAVTTPKRTKLLPDAPTLAEGGVPGFEIVGWYGVVAPPKTPAAIVNTLNTNIRRSLAAPEMQEKMEASGAEAPQTTPQELNGLITKEIDKISKIIKETGIKLQ